MARTLTALVLPTLLLSLALAAPVPRDAGPTPPPYFPTRVGDKRTYGWNNGPIDCVETVTGVGVVGGTCHVTTQVTYNFEDCPLKTTAVTDAGLFLVSYGEKRLDAPYCFLKEPAVPGTTWTIDGKDKDGRPWSRAHRVVGPEWVEVPAGRFHALRVDEENGPKPDAKKWTNWYARGVGLIKRVERMPDGTVEDSFALKSFTPGPVRTGSK